MVVARHQCAVELGASLCDGRDAFVADSHFCNTSVLLMADTTPRTASNARDVEGIGGRGETPQCSLAAVQGW
jgi:hypothetical protein